jgi:REP element-mobilizing transposase RayT
MPILREDEDRRFFLAVAAKLFREMNVECLAWAVMLNHYHLILRPLATPLGDVMHRLDLIYAQYFNEKHGRTGHAFENRYWNSLSHDSEVLRIQMRYVHTNPLRGKVVTDLDALELYPWTGHAELMGRAPTRLLSRDAALREFGRTEEEALREIRLYFEAGVRAVRLDAPTLESALAEACRVCGVRPVDVISGRRMPAISRARMMTVHLAVHRAGLSIRAAARGLGVSASGAHQALRRAEEHLASGELVIP